MVACIRTKNKNQIAIASTFRGAYFLTDSSAHVKFYTNFWFIITIKNYCYPMFLDEGTEH